MSSDWSVWYYTYLAELQFRSAKIACITNDIVESHSVNVLLIKAECQHLLCSNSKCFGDDKRSIIFQIIWDSSRKWFRDLSNAYYSYLTLFLLFWYVCLCLHGLIYFSRWVVSPLCLSLIFIKSTRTLQNNCPLRKSVASICAPSACALIKYFKNEH